MATVNAEQSMTTPLGEGWGRVFFFLKVSTTFWRGTPLPPPLKMLGQIFFRKTFFGASKNSAPPGGGGGGGLDPHSQKGAMGPGVQTWSLGYPPEVGGGAGCTPPPPPLGPSPLYNNKALAAGPSAVAERLHSALKTVAVWIPQMCWGHDPPPMERHKRWGQHSGFGGPL